MRSNILGWACNSGAPMVKPDIWHQCGKNKESRKQRTPFGNGYPADDLERLANSHAISPRHTASVGGIE